MMNVTTNRYVRSTRSPMMGRIASFAALLGLSLGVLAQDGGTPISADDRPVYYDLQEQRLHIPLVHAGERRFEAMLELVPGDPMLFVVEDLYPDADTDGYSTSPYQADCNDTDPNINPGASEITGNDVDEDCDGDADDRDGDGYTIDQGDCNDTDADINPAAQETSGNDVDENCDGEADDRDGDEHTIDEGDCNDTDAEINPDAQETSGNDVDENCDGQLHPDDIDNDGDGYVESELYGPEIDCNDTDPSIHPGATSIPDNGVDEDCDGYDPSTYATWNLNAPGLGAIELTVPVGHSRITEYVIELDLVCRGARGSVTQSGSISVRDTSGRGWEITDNQFSLVLENDWTGELLWVITVDGELDPTSLRGQGTWRYENYEVDAVCPGSWTGVVTP